MKLNELIEAFQVDYKFEALKRGVTEINLPSKYLALMLSKTVSDLQKKLGVVEASYTFSTSNGTASYDISSSFMTPKVVTLDGIPLERRPIEWIKSQYQVTGTPSCYGIDITSATPKIRFYPTPSGVASAIIYCNYNYNLYSPSGASAQDFGTFDGKTFSGNTVFPTLYDHAMLLGMMKQVFKDVEQDYNKEVRLIRVKQYNGVPLEYEFGKEKLITGAGGGFSYSEGVTELNLDQASKECRMSLVYGGNKTIDFIRDFAVSPVFASDDGNIITITSTAEFGTKTIIIPNNQNVDINRVDASTITIEYFGNDYGTLELIILVYG